MFECNTDFLSGILIAKDVLRLSGLDNYWTMIDLEDAL